MEFNQFQFMYVRYFNLKNFSTKILEMQGNLMHTVSSISTPIISDVNIAFTFQRNKDEIVIDNLGDNENAVFRLYIDYIELQVWKFENELL